jgi:hypothetical protein
MTFASLLAGIFLGGAWPPRKGSLRRENHNKKLATLQWLSIGTVLGIIWHLWHIDLPIKIWLGYLMILVIPFISGLILRGTILQSRVDQRVSSAGQ